MFKGSGRGGDQGVGAGHGDGACEGASSLMWLLVSRVDVFLTSHLVLSRF